MAIDINCFDNIVNSYNFNKATTTTPPLLTKKNLAKNGGVIKRHRLKALHEM